MQSTCRKLYDEISELQHYDTRLWSEYKARLQIDKRAMTLIPTDFPNHKDILPINVRADGNCLPHSGNLLTYDNQNHNNEIRSRLAIELAIHRNLYLDEGHLQKGITI